MTIDPGKATSSETEAEAARQEVLERLGVLGSYVAPSMMVLMNSKQTAQAVSSSATN